MADTPRIEYDVIPVRLPSGTRAIVQLPRPFTMADGVHLMNFLSEYVEEAIEKPVSAAPSTLVAPGTIRPLPGEQVQVERRRFPESGTE